MKKKIIIGGIIISIITVIIFLAILYTKPVFKPTPLDFEDIAFDIPTLIAPYDSEK